MTPNNNLSVLPWYTSIEQQNARKWWVYNRVYPLFAPAQKLLPFQIIRNLTKEYIPGTELDNEDQGGGYITMLGEWEQAPAGYMVDSILLDSPIDNIYIERLAKPMEMGVAIAFLDDMDELLETVTPETWENNQYTGGFPVPDGTARILIQSSGPGQADYAASYEATTSVAPVTTFEIYDKNGTLVTSVDPEDMGITIKSFDAFNYEVIVFPGNLPVTSLQNGQYYAKLSDGVNTWYSEVFTAVNDMEPYLRIVWWDENDFKMDAGTIVYKNPDFKNVLYLDASIAKPEYIFEDEGETRDGYFFPIKQISEKRYRFSFLASEYLLDVMRFIRMADYAFVTKNGQTYHLDTFLITPEWEDNGDVASVKAEFDTATVAKKLGLAYVRAQGGDFNDDFLEDFDN